MGLSTTCPGCGKDLAVAASRPELRTDATVEVTLRIAEADVEKHRACFTAPAVPPEPPLTG